MATIKAIEAGTVHQIQSGQIIVDLCSVVKELVENSLDAGATSIDVRFKNQGIDAIEVQDNGDGISQHNYETLALKHHTSKLSTYSDLTTLQTFGFRGEALSSLCALSKFSVVTCLAADAPKGTRLDFATSGKLAGTSVVAAQKGTTVSVENLFNNLPVRRRELERNIKREWGKVVGVLGQYACIQTGIKFSVSQQAGKGKKTTLFSTKGNQTTRENIVNVFGAKTLTSLITLNLDLELEPTSAPSQRWSAQEDGGKKAIRIVGHISRPASGEGRQTPDRQMFFVNARPCGLPQVSKAFNEVYKAYNGHQSPFICANIELDTHMYDVNVSPDKRTILLHDQSRMLDNLKEALTALFESQDYTVPISQLPAQKQPTYKQLTISRENGVAKTPQTPARALSESAEISDSEDGSRSAVREQSRDDEGSAKKFNPQFRRGAVSRETMTKNADALNLISKWAGRKSESHLVQDDDGQSPASKEVPTILAGLSEETRKLVEKLRREGEQKKLALENSEEAKSSVTTTQSTTAPASAQPDTHLNESGSEIDEDAPQDLPGDEEDLFVSQDPVPALASPPKPTPSLADRFMSTPRPFKSQAEIATIKIGGHTITSSIGTPYPTTKKARVEHVPGLAGLKAQSQISKGTLPSFGGTLSQRFSAPGTAAQPTPAADDVEEGSLSNDHPSPEIIGSDSENDISPEDPAALDIESTTREVVVKEEEEEDIDSSAMLPDVEENEEVLSEDQKKALEESKVEAMIQDAETAAIQPSQENMARIKSMLRGGWKKKDATINLVRVVETSTAKIGEQQATLEKMLSSYQQSVTEKAEGEALDSENAEEKLSLTISKDDFAKMKIVGQFNLGFILASRSKPRDKDGDSTSDDLFIIDQHASDEKYNFERLQATTIVQSQRLVHSKTLDLTAMEEEVVLENLPALETNGFVVTVDESGESPVGKRCQLVSLPVSRETAFSVSDLEELIALLADHQTGTVPRPSKVRKMFAMRACRSSIMIGKTLTQKQMERVVKHLGELDKPWNCPHGRPTMRHLSRLGVWDELGWEEGCDSQNGTKGSTNWAAYVRQNRVEEEDEDEEGEEGEEEGEASQEEISDDMEE